VCRAACTKPLLAAVFIIGYQHFRKYFENIFEKVCKFKKALYICIVKQLKQSKMTTTNNTPTASEVIMYLAHLEMKKNGWDFEHALKIVKNNLNKMGLLK